MGLSKQKIRSFVEPVSIKCGLQQCETVSGINIYKQFMPSRNFGADTSNYSIVPPGCFAFNLMHVGRDEKIPVALNDTNQDIIVSPAYFVFKVSDEEIVKKEYLNIVMSSPEFDRYAWFCTDSSIRGNLDWERFCEIEIELPPTHVQNKYVNVYSAILNNQKAYEKGLDDVKLTCDAFIDELRRNLPHIQIGQYLELSEAKNSNLNFGVDSVKGISIEKRFIETKADMSGVSLCPYYLVEPDAFAYVTVTSRNGEKISLAHNNSDEIYICSSSYVVFNVIKKEMLLPSYLQIFLSRSEFDRYARFHSWGSARETFAWEDMQDVKIPIPDINVQQAIVDIYNVFLKRRVINEKLKTQIKDICPILIKGSLEEAACS